ncbi:MAG: glutamate racemase [Odoribacter sp.]|nr:glutamate racemase [Odoribacter sp.]
MSKCPIGIFDSGYGGLTILKEIVGLLPQYDYIYLGDNALNPYGTRSFEVVYQYTREAVFKLFDMGCELIILACNTASAKALRTIQQKDLPILQGNKRVLGVIRPSVEALSTFSKNKHVGILGTKGTVASNSYPIEIEKLYGETHFHVSQLACPLWVPLIENNELIGEGTVYFVKKYINDLLTIDSQIDTIILGCTHYPLLINMISEYTPKEIKIVEQGAIIAESLKDYLYRHPEIETHISKNSQIEYFTTEKAFLFNQMAKIFMGNSVEAREVKL